MKNKGEAIVSTHCKAGHSILIPCLGCHTLNAGHSLLFISTHGNLEAEDLANLRWERTR